MGDYDPYVQALLAEASNNSYNTFGGIASSLSGEAAKAALQPEQDLGEALLYSSVLGMLGGGLSQYGKQSALDDYNAVAPLLYGQSNEVPDGLSSLGKQALSYRDLIKRNNLSALNTLATEETLKDKVKFGGELQRSKFDDPVGHQQKVDNYLQAVQGNSAADSPETGGAIVPIEGDVLDEMSPNEIDYGKVSSDILTKVPQAERGDAKEELAVVEQIDKAMKVIDKSINDAAANRNWEQGIDQILPFGLELPNLSEKSRMRNTAATGIISAVRPIWGTISADDIAVVIDPLLPEYGDSAKVVENKRDQLKALVISNSPSTPTLNRYGIEVAKRKRGSGGKTAQDIVASAKAADAQAAAEPASTKNLTTEQLMAIVNGSN